MRRTMFFIFAILLMISIGAFAQELTEKKGAYFGEPLPGDSALIFAPGIISNALTNRDVAITPDGNEMYFGIAGRNAVFICYTKLINGKWTYPELAPFSGSRDYFDFEPHISPDGKHLYFLSTRPKKGQEPKPGWAYQDIWAMDKTEKGWSEPYNLGEPINTDEGEYYPSVTKKGTLYFTRELNGKSFIYRSRLINGKYENVERVPLPIDSLTNIFNAFISPNEDFMIFCSNEIKDKIGLTDYFIVFHSADDKWSKPINMGPKINSRGDVASSATVTPDGKYLFFASNRTAKSNQNKQTFKGLIEMWNSYQNGSADIYWMSAKIIDELKEKAWQQ